MTVLWFRRDLRLADNPALLAAARRGSVVPLFVLDPSLWGRAGTPRRAFLVRCLRDLDERVGGGLVVRAGAPAEVVPALVSEVAAGEVHVAADFGVYGRDRDARVEAALRVPLIRTGSPYAVAPGRLTTAAGTGFRVFSAYYRAWQTHGWREPAGDAADVQWMTDVPSTGLPPEPDLGGVTLPPAGETAARRRFSGFAAEAVSRYAERRNTPAEDGTSRLSAYLKYGCVHPRSLLHGLGRSKGEESFRRELAWRDFYADVLWHRPDTLHAAVQPKMAGLRYDDDAAADERFTAWATGRTGYPIVDAGMRQLQSEAWMHNRVRMITASFLTKDLHIDWRRGAEWFLEHLVDGDPASNHGGWQWVAGTGTDPAPYFRVFNPVTQSKTVDPDGDYIRRYVPELRDVEGDLVHEPWRLPAGPPAGYPLPIVDHAEERAEALRRYAEVTGI